jgi:WD40 repeat protein
VEGVVKIMLLNKVKIGSMLVALVLLIGGAGLTVYPSEAGNQVVANPPPQPSEAKPKEPKTLDLYGDALPAGAVARLDTLRFRHADVITFAAFLPGGEHVITVGDDGIICVWEFPSGKEISRIEACPARERPAGLVVNGMNAAALSPDGKSIATSFTLGPPTRGKGAKGGKGGGPLDKPAVLPQQDIRLHDVATGKQRSVLKTDTTTVTALSFSPNGQQLSAWCSDRTIRFWDWANSKELNKVDTMAAGGRVSPITGALLRAVKGGFSVYAPDGKTLMLFGTSRVLQFMDVATGKEVGPSLGHTVSLTSISFTPDGKQVLTQAANFVHRWDADSSKALGTLKLPPGSTRAQAVSADGRVGVAAPGVRPDQALGGIGFGNRATFKDPSLFDTANGKVLGKIADEFIPDSAMVFSPNGKILAATGVGAEPKISFYEVPSGKLLRTSDAIPGALPVLGKGGGFPGRANPGIRMLFAPDGKTLAVHPGPVETALVFLDTSGKQIGSIAPPADGRALTLSAFSADGRCLAVERSDGEVLLYELASGQPRRTFSNKSLPPAEKVNFADSLLFGSSGTNPSMSLALSPDGRWLALAGGDGAVRLQDIWTGKELAVFKGHKGAVNAVAFAPHGKTMASASADMTALIWDVTKIDRPAKAPQPGNLKAQWQMLADKDAAKAFAALGDFAAAPKDAVAFLKDKIKAEPPLDGKRVEALIRQMDKGEFKLRDQATRELLNLGEPILPALDNALAANPPLESKRRLEDLRSKLTGMVLEGERLRVDRALEVLERIGTPEARAVLQAWADGAPGALVTTRARAALNR